MSRRKTIFTVLGYALLLSFVGPELAIGSWKMVKTKYLNLYYQGDRDLKLFDEKIKPVERLGNYKRFSRSNGNKGQHADLAGKVDTLVEKVQLILDMRKPIRINVRIYSDRTALATVYFQIYKKHKNLRAWYIFEYNTIYLQVDDLFSGMLAHEVAHAVVDNYLDVRPPRATAEILARYVDAHLNKEAKIY